MNLRPVIARELSANARQSSTYWLRVWGAAAAVLATFLYAGGALNGGFQGAGAIVFTTVHRAVFLSIWVGVPWLVADAISRERREGTLGLLFLTSLKPHEIVVAKTLVHGLRALTLWLSILPVMSLAFILGGVGWRQGLMSVAVNLSAISLALAAGLIATSVCRRWLRAMVLATCLSLAAMVFCIALWGAAQVFMTWSVVPLPRTIMLSGQGYVTVGGMSPYYGPTGGPLPGSIAIKSGGGFSLLEFVLLRTSLSLCVLVTALLLAGARVQRVWQEVPPPIWLTRLNDFFCQPRYFRRFLSRWMKWQIQHNPIGWLEQRVWTGRIVIWSWFAVIVTLYSAFFSYGNLYMRVFDAVQVLLSVSLMLFLSASAAGSFRRERETGVLELLLVSPTTERRIIGGRLQALWGRFLPAMILLVLVWMTFPKAFGNEAPTMKVMLLISSYLTLPVTGLYESLHRRSYLASLVWTLVMGVLLPFVVATALMYPFLSMLIPFRAGWRYSSQQYYAIRYALLCGVQVLMALRCGYYLHRNLARRRFVLDRTGES